MLRLLQIPVWHDNYIWLLAKGHRALVIDPADDGAVMEVLKHEGLTLEAILNTHHHPDHVGGNQALVQATGCQVIGARHDRERLPGLTDEVECGQTLSVLDLDFRVLDVRAHTLGHICFALDTKVDEVVRWGHGGQARSIPRLARRPLLFVGDSLFLGGCGRLFEGSHEQLAAVMALYQKESPEALVCCAHEYTASNLQFGAHVLPLSEPIAERLANLDQERAETSSSVPDTLAREFETNVFLLALDRRQRDDIATAMKVPADDEAALVGALRAAKDSF